MKKMKAFAFVLFSLALICLIIFMVYSMLTGPDMKLFKYYSDKESFQAITSKVTSITVGDEAVYITLADSNPNFTGADFQINGKNYEKIIQTDFEKSIKEGNTVTIMAAPKYYSDGWSYPVAYMECNGNVYLDFGTGQANLVDYYREYRNNNLPLYIILLSLMAAFTAAGATLLIVNNKKSSKKKENNI